MSANQSIVIVGTGFAGLGMAIRLQQEGFYDFVMLERASELGGVWRDNHYPGICCDIESHLYSFSFEPNPDWTRTFPTQKEILAYLNRCADRYDLRKKIRFDCAASSARFDEATGLWHVGTSQGDTIIAQTVISAAGLALSRPVYPDIPGRETFVGKSFHSARWDHSFSLEGKSIAVIGTGASAIQIIPSIAPEAGHLTVFQRTPAWVVPRRDRAISEETRERFRRFPALQRMVREAIYWRHEAIGYGFVKSPGMLRWLGKMARAFMSRHIRDPELKTKLTPNYTMGCKRILISDDYYPALARPNVEVVTDKIREIRPHSIVTEDGREHAVEVIVFATGFEAAEAAPSFEVKGRGGPKHARDWTHEVEAYLGTTISGFPNLFVIIGPNTGLGHSSMILMMESQIQYILEALKLMRDRGLKFVDVRRDVEARYNEEIQARLVKTVWAIGGCNSWYINSRGRNTTLWPGFTFEFRNRTRRFDSESYELVKS